VVQHIPGGLTLLYGFPRFGRFFSFVLLVDEPPVFRIHEENDPQGFMPANYSMRDIITPFHSDNHPSELVADI